MMSSVAETATLKQVSKGVNSMTNTELLEEWIKKSGKKKKFLAEKVGLSYAGFRNCCINVAEFTTSQVSILCEELNITRLSDKEAVFYARR